MTDLAEEMKQHAEGYVHAKRTESLLLKGSATITELADECERLRAANRALVEAAGRQSFQMAVQIMEDMDPMYRPDNDDSVTVRLRAGDLRALARAVEAAHENRL